MTRKPSDSEMARAKTGRLVAIVIALTMVLWILAQTVGRALGLPGEYALLFDFMALAALFWSLVVAFRLWRMRGKD
ncbi:MAG: DUF5337 domain-containing protein [Pseudomonadota bacterium]